MILLLASTHPGRIGSPVLGMIIPAVILLISFVSTWMLYRYFSRK